MNSSSSSASIASANLEGVFLEGVRLESIAFEAVRLETVGGVFFFEGVFAEGLFEAILEAVLAHIGHRVAAHVLFEQIAFEPGALHGISPYIRRLPARRPR
jgi:hypothetical protein